MPSSVARITEISAQSDVSFEDAIKVGIDRANETIRNITGAWVKEQKVDIDGGQIKSWRVILEVTFILE